MKLTVMPEQLRAALDVAARAVGKDRSLPIVGNVLLEATPDGGLSVTGTDLKTRASRTVAADVSEPGLVCLPPAAIDDVLGAVPGTSELAIAVDKRHKAVLTCGRTVVRIAGHDPEGFPAATSDDDPSAELSLWVDTFRDLVETVAFAASSDDARPTITGVLIEARDGELQWTAADSARSAYRAIPLHDPSLSFSIVVPASRLSAASAGLKAARGDVRLVVTSDRSRLIVESDAGRWSVVLIDGTYPDLSRSRQAVPTALLTVGRAELIRACKLVQNVTTAIEGDGKKQVRATKAVLTIGADSLGIRAGEHGADHEASTDIDAVLERGEPTTVALNTGSLKDALEALAGDKVTLELEGANRPILVRDATATDRNHSYIVIQMMLANVGVGRAS